MKHVLVDIDGTVTGLKNNPYQEIDGIGCDYFRGILRDMMVKKFGLTPSLALTMIQKKDPLYNGCIFRIAPTLGIPEEKLWREVLSWQKHFLSVYADAVDMVKALFSKGFPLSVVSNNSCKGVLAKLNHAGLADMDGSPYFKEINGMDLFGLGWDKSRPEVYRRVLKEANISPGEAVMVGDEPVIDLESPHRAGIKHCIIVDRNQKERIVTKDGGIFVRTLRAVSGVLEMLK